MINSIQHFHEFGVKDLEKVMMTYSADMTKIAEMVYGVTESVVNLGLSIIAEELEMYDEYLRKSDKRKQEWDIVKKDETTLLTSLGNVTYKKTLFQNKQTGEREYLLDRAMHLKKHTRMTEDAEARMLEEVVQNSYRKGEEDASIGSEAVSRQTVKNKVHQLIFPKTEPQPEKKVLSYLYVDADHVSLQQKGRHGDGDRKKVENIVMPKLVYVYEGITNEDGRNELVNRKLIGGAYEGAEDNRKLWKEVWDYIAASYDVDRLKTIYINGDGAAWIKAGAKYLPKGRFVLDRFHMHKYIIGATSHLNDSTEDARSDLYSAIHKRKKHVAEEVFERILNVTEGVSKRKTVEAAKLYIMGNWTGIMEQMKEQGHKSGCSAESHISHIYADRMSSRPLGWSKTGADRMAKLRVYYYNGGKMLELVRYHMYDRYVRDGFGKRKIGEIKYSDVMYFYYHLLNDMQLQPSTVDTIHTLLHPTFQLAVRDGIIRMNPSSGVMADIKKKAGKNKRIRHALTIEQQRAFMNYIANNPIFSHWLPLFTVLLGTGCRIGEIVGLRWEDLDFENRLININHSVTYYPREGSKTRKSEFAVSLPKTETGIRTVPMMDAVYDAFQEEYEVQKERGFNSTVIDGMTGFVFCNRNGNIHNPQTVNKAIKRILENHNVEEIVKVKRERRQPVIIPNFSCHHLRHTFCTRFCEQETNVKVIQSVMGHANIQTTMDIYAEVTDAKKKETIENLSHNLEIF